MKAIRLLCSTLLLIAAGLVTQPAMAADPVIGDWALIEFNADQTSGVGCNVVGGSITRYFDRLECGFLHASISQDGVAIASTSTVTYEIERPNGTIWITEPGVFRTADSRWQLSFEFCNDFALGFCAPALPAGDYIVRLIEVNSVVKNFGELTFTLNGMGGRGPSPAAIAPGQGFTLTGDLFTIDEEPVTTQTSMLQETGVPGTFDVELLDASNNVLGTVVGETAVVDGTFSVNMPGSFTTTITTSQTLSARIINANYDELNGVSATTENWHADVAGNIPVQVNVGLGGGGEIKLRNSFVSGVGWVKPGETYPWRIFVENSTNAAINDAVVTIPVPDGTTFTKVTPLGGAGTAIMGGGSFITWTIGTVPQFSTVTLVAEARADTAIEDPRIVWKDLSNTATLDYTGAVTPLESATHGPKVIPPMASYNSARFGDRPYVVVPADYTDRKHDNVNHTGDALEAKLNDPNQIGSTFNLWQENSFGQLYPNGAIGSAGVATADFTVDWKDPNRTDNEFTFSNNLPGGTCHGTDFSALAGTAAYPERVSGGWYQLPRDTAYYGGDKYGTALIGALGGVGLIFAIDDACGPTGKAVYDSAHIADPEIDYNDYDSDKDGVVDFFMLVYVGTGGHGSSQTSVPPYDNIWPHSSSLEFYFTDANGLKGYVSDDQLKSLTEVPQCYVDTTRTSFDDCVANGGTGNDSLPTYVRVGPYNVNPEDAIDNASVISHEYGHSLGLPDFYCTGSKSCYGDWNLMSTDKSQHMDVFTKQELGWIVPVPLAPGQSFASGWKESKHDTGEIHWQQPDGTPYTLSAGNGDQNIHNTEAYVAKLPAALVIDPALVAAGASPDNVWWSGAGNDFGCPGHVFDFGLSPQEVGPGQTVSIDFASWWEIEWDWDYGFVLVSTDLGATWQSLASTNAYTTPGAFNPNANGCQDQYGNGLTGTSGSYLGGTDTPDRATGSFTPATTFTPDNYTFVMPGGADAGLLVRLSYATDPAVAGRGWFIDDLSASVDGTVVFSSDFEDDDGDGRWFADGFSLISATLGSQADRAYYLEMRDRTGFDHTGNGENDRAAIGFLPGLLLTITDEVVGYGNTGSGDFPNQSPVDANPQPGNQGADPALFNAAFRAAGVAHYDDTTGDGDDGWHDNYNDGAHPSGDWVHDFNCLTFDVTAMSGTDIGPAYPIPGNLVGDVTFNLGTGCGEFIYWPPMECFDVDADGLCDDVDNCPLVANPDQLDQDLDTVGDLCDNCLLEANPDQCNTNSHIDNFGNLCDTDLDNNNIVNSFDLSILRDNFGAAGSNDSDFNCDNTVNSFDLTIMRDTFGGMPGPTGIVSP